MGSFLRLSVVVGVGVGSFWVGRNIDNAPFSVDKVFARSLNVVDEDITKSVTPFSKSGDLDNKTERIGQVCYLLFHFPSKSKVNRYL